MEYSRQDCYRGEGGENNWKEGGFRESMESWETIRDKEGVKCFPCEGRGGHVACWHVCPLSSWVIWVQGDSQLMTSEGKPGPSEEFKSWEESFPHWCVWAHRHTTFIGTKVTGRNSSPLEPATLQRNEGKPSVTWRVTGKIKAWEYNVIISFTDYIKANHWNGKKF